MKTRTAHRRRYRIYPILLAALLALVSCRGAPTPAPAPPTATATATATRFSQGAFTVTLDAHGPPQWTYTVTAGEGDAMASIDFGSSGLNPFIPDGCHTVLPEGSAWTVRPGELSRLDSLVAPEGAGAAAVTFTLDCRQARQVHSGPWLAVVITPTQGDPVRIDQVIGPFVASFD